jgi:hypothetical protein
MEDGEQRKAQSDTNRPIDRSFVPIHLFLRVVLWQSTGRAPAGYLEVVARPTRAAAAVDMRLPSKPRSWTASPDCGADADIARVTCASRANHA